MPHTRLRVRTLALAAAMLAVAHSSLFAQARPDTRVMPGKYVTTWVAATSATNPMGMQVKAMHVAADGTVYTNGNWDEIGRESNILDANTGERLGGMRVDHPVHGGFVTGNADAVFVQVHMNSLSRNEFRTGNRLGEVVDVGRRITGMAAGRDELFVTHFADNLVQVLDARTLKTLRSFPVPKPSSAAVAADGSLWVVTGDVPRIEFSSDPTPPGIALSHYSPDGRLLGKIEGKVERPRGMVITADDRLIVADDGRDQNFKIFSNISTQPSDPVAFGVVGGVFAGNGPEIGKMGPMRFVHPMAVGVDRAGHIYTAEFASYVGGGAIVSKYTPSGDRLWVNYSLAFEDGADFDPGVDARSGFDKRIRYEMDWSKPAGQEWKPAGYTHNWFRYPDDARNHMFMDNPATTHFVRIKGKPFFFLQRQTRPELQIFRFNPETDGETAIPCALVFDIYGPFDPNEGYPRGGIRHDDMAERPWPPHRPPMRDDNPWIGWIWVDKNDNATIEPGEFTQPPEDGPQRTYVSTIGTDGSLWQAFEKTVFRVPFDGFTPAGTPLWDMSKREAYPVPPGLEGVGRMEYDADRDIMILTGNVPGVPNNPDFWGVIGTGIARYDNWSKTPGNWKPTWVSTDLEFDVRAKSHREMHLPVAIALEGDYVFIAYFGGIDTGGVRVIRLSDGKSIGTLKPSGGFPTYDADTIGAVEATRRENGEYIVSFNEHAHGRILVYRWTPPEAAAPAAGAAAD